MTSRERIDAIFKNKSHDRAPYRFWALNIREDRTLLNPAYKKATDEGLLATDIMSSSNSPFNFFCGKRESELVRKEIVDDGNPNWYNEITYITTPNGVLRSIKQVSKLGKPGFQLEYLIKTPEDLKSLLKIDYQPYKIDLCSYNDLDKMVGNRGIVTLNLSHAPYALQTLTGSELLSFFSIDNRDLVIEAIEIFQKRLIDHIKEICSLQKIPYWGWVGPELFIPPLFSPSDFGEFCTPYDKQTIELIHNSGGYVWVHSHGKMKNVIEQFIDTGIDVLNPIEPPPMGDLTMEEAAKVTSGRIGLEGGVETHDFYVMEEEEFRNKIDETVKGGVKSGRFYLGTCSGYMEDPLPTERFIYNLSIFVDQGLKSVTKYRY